MLARLSSSAFARLWIVLLLAIIGLHAAGPTGAIERIQGSAFSAGSYEVALAQRAEAVQAQPALVPLPPPSRVAPMLHAIVPVLERPALRPDSSGHHALTILARQPGPRPPPSA